MYGIDTNIIEVEVDVAATKSAEDPTIGLPDAAVLESHDRVRAALQSWVPTAD